MIRSAFFKAKHPPTRPAREWGADALPGPRAAPVRAPDGVVRPIIAVPKSAPVRSEAYRRFVASHPCFGCGIEGWSQAAHPNAGKGLALKTCDLLCFPLCAPHIGRLGCHLEHDLRIDMGRSESREIEVAYTQRMQRIARAAGRMEFA